MEVRTQTGFRGLQRQSDFSKRQVIWANQSASPSGSLNPFQHRRIAEGCGRQTPRDTINFLFIARGSLYELETQIYVALDLNYLPAETAEALFVLVTSCKKLLHDFINHYRQQLV